MIRYITPSNYTITVVSVCYSNQSYHPVNSTDPATTRSSGGQERSMQSSPVTPSGGIVSEISLTFPSKQPTSTDLSPGEAHGLGIWWSCNNFNCGSTGYQQKWRFAYDLFPSAPPHGSSILGEWKGGSDRNDRSDWVHGFLFLVLEYLFIVISGGCRRGDWWNLLGRWHFEYCLKHWPQVSIRCPPNGRSTIRIFSRATPITEGIHISNNLQGNYYSMALCPPKEP